MRNVANTPARRFVLVLLLSGLAAQLVIILLLALRLAPTGVPGQWEWPWRDPAQPYPYNVWALPLLPLLLALQLVRLLYGKTPSRTQRACFVLFCCLVAAAWIIALESAEPASPLHLAVATASTATMGYFGYATAIPSPRTILVALSGQTAGAPPLSDRLVTHPPGPVLAYYIGLRLCEACPALVASVEDILARAYGVTRTDFWALARWLAMPTVQPYHFVPALLLGLGITLLGALLPLPLYCVSRALAGPRGGLIAAFCGLLIPSLAVFCPSIDGFAAVLAAASVAIWIRSLRRGSYGLALMAGLVCVAALFWTLGLALIGLVIIATAVPALQRPRCRRRTLELLFLFAATIIVSFGLLYVATGYNVLANIQLMLESQRRIMAERHRTYGPWLLGNLYDLLLFMGPALLAACLAALSLFSRLGRFARSYSWGVTFALLCLWLSGSTLGEVGRIWLFLMGLLAPAAAFTIPTLPPASARLWLGLLALAQAILTVVLHARLALVHL